MELNMTFKEQDRDLSEYLHYYHTNQKNYLAVQFDEEERYFETGMILNNKLPYLLPVSYRQYKDHYELYYDISNMQSLDVIHRLRQYHFPELSDYLMCLKTLLDRLDDHLLNADDLVLREEYLFVSYEGNRLGVLYLPGYGVSFRKQMKDLNEQIMKRLDHYDERATRLIYELDRLFCLENWNFDELGRILKEKPAKTETEEKVSKTETPAEEQVGNTDRKTERAADVEGTLRRQAGAKKKETWLTKLAGHRKPDPLPMPMMVREGEEEYGNNDPRSEKRITDPKEEPEENTGLLQEEVLSTPVLIPIDHDRSRIPIGSDQVVIGSLKERTDVYLEDTHVSRMHLRIFRENERWYIMDQNSTNGTFLEEERLMPYEKYELADRNRIRIADREYTFRMDF